MDKQEQVMIVFQDLMNKRAWLDKNKMEKQLRGYKASEVHCIEYIGRNGDANVTKLAQSFYMTRGAISKLARKLLAKNVISSYQKPDNKKEIYFRLTDQGQAVYHIHKLLHEEFKERDKIIFDQLTDEQFSSILTFAETYSRHLDTEIKKQGLSVNAE